MLYRPGAIMEKACPTCKGIVEAGEEITPHQIATGGDPVPPQTTRTLRATCRTCGADLRYDTSSDRLSRA